MYSDPTNTLGSLPPWSRFRTLQGFGVEKLRMVYTSFSAVLNYCASGSYWNRPERPDETPRAEPLAPPRRTYIPSYLRQTAKLRTSAPSGKYASLGSLVAFKLVALRKTHRQTIRPPTGPLDRQRLCTGEMQDIVAKSADDYGGRAISLDSVSVEAAVCRQHVGGTTPSKISATPTTKAWH